MTSLHQINQRLHSGLAALTADAIEAQAARAHEEYILEGGEMIQRIQAPIAGRVGAQAVWTEIDVHWPYPFLNRTMQSQIESAQANPHFNYGVEMQSAAHVAIDVQVREWYADDSDFVLGAKVRVAAWAPGAAKMVRYQAVAHLTFMGYAAASEDDDDTTQGES